MKTPLKLEVDKIAAVVKKKFDINVTELEFIPEGEVSWIYKCRANDKQWVIKIQKKRPSKASELITEALLEAGYKWMPAQVLTIKGDIWSRYKGMYYSVQQYFEPGKNSHMFKLDDEYLPQLGEALRALHETTLPEHILAQVPKQDYYSWAKSLKRLLLKTRYKPSEEARELRTAVLGRRKHINTLLRVFEKQSEARRHQHIRKVLVHGDIHPHNILRPENDHIYIVDWDTMSLSDRERDLMYFDDRQINLISQGYGVDLLENKAGIEYFRQYLLIRELAFFGDKQALNGQDKLTRQAGLASFRESLKKVAD